MLQPGDFASQVLGVGDVSADGYGDLAVAVVGGSVNRVYVFSGGPTGIKPALYTLLPSHPTSERPLAAGDFNGDGYADIVVAQPSPNPGSVLVFHGSSSGIGTTPATTLTSPVAGRLEFGRWIATAGDVNGDGYADLLVGESVVTMSFQYFFVHVFLGGPTGLAATPASTITSPYSYVAKRDFRGIGDVNGDGYGDVAIAYYNFHFSPLPEDQEGHVEVHLGGATGLSSTALVTLDPPDPPITMFGASYAGTGDLDGDGLFDLLVAAYGTDVTGSAPPKGTERTGRVHVYLGAKTGFGVRAYKRDPPFKDDRNFGFRLGSIQ